MASKFRIASYQSSNTLYLVLQGDFDSNSAWELFHLLMKNTHRISTYIINTDELNDVFSFGVHTFHNLMKELKKKNIRVLVTGNKTNLIFSETNEQLNYINYLNKSNHYKSKRRMER